MLRGLRGLRGHGETGFCDVQSGAAKNKISLFPSLSHFTFLSRPSSFLPSSVSLSSSILSLSVPLRTFRNAMRAKSIVGRQSIPSITAASLSSHDELGKSHTSAFVTRYFLAFSLSLSFSAPLFCCFSSFLILFDTPFVKSVRQKHHATLSLYIVVEHESQDRRRTYLSSLLATPLLEVTLVVR